MPTNRPFIFTVFNCFALLALGVLAGQKESCFNDIILISNTDVQGGSYYLTASNLGYLLGAMLAGQLYDRIKATSLSIATAMTLAGVFIALTPLCTVFTSMIIVYGVVSVFQCMFETTVTTEEIAAWDGSSQSALQFLSFCYSVGGVVSPLFTEPFMAPRDAHNKESNHSNVHKLANNNNNNNLAHSTYEQNIFTMTPNLTIFPGTFSNETTRNCTKYEFPCAVSPNDTFDNTGVHSKSELKSKVIYAYLITACYCFAISLCFFVAFIVRRNSKKGEKRRKKEEDAATSSRKLPKKVYLGVAGLACLYYYFHTMGIDTFGQYLFFFVVNYLDWSKETAAYLKSMQFAFSMAFKIITLVLFRYIHYGHVLLFCVLGVVLSSVLFVVASQLHLHILIWIATGLLATTQSPIFGSGFSWVDGNLIKLDGRMTGSLMVASALGAMTAPLPLGYLMKNWTILTFPYFVAIQFCISASIFLIEMFVIKPILNRTYGPMRREETIKENMKFDAGDCNSTMLGGLQEDCGDIHITTNHETFIM